MARPHNPGQVHPVRLRIGLPLPPSVNNQYVSVGRRRVLSAPAKAFKRDVAKIVERARLDGTIDLRMEATLRASLIGVYLTFYFETPMKRDLDGGLKIALDALCGALGVDDRTVVDLHLTKQIDPLRPRLEVELETIVDWSFDRSYVYLGDPAPGTDDDDSDGGDT
ncbi:MAG: RusA family crossover junction endodeoxyribonuclease [Thermomicrobiales bacterium]|nr:RusA family crossover junction endodeoxyribonuclease [Thermomicrobiales bacterium]